MNPLEGRRITPMRVKRLRRSRCTTITPSRVTTSVSGGPMIGGWAQQMADLTYEVSFKGVAGPTLRAAFDDCEVDAGGGVTMVRCTQDALRSVIARVEEFGLELLDVLLIAEHPDDHRPASGG
jgi:hypothetical protein